MDKMQKDSFFFLVLLASVALFSIFIIFDNFSYFKNPNFKLPRLVRTTETNLATNVKSEAGQTYQGTIQELEVSIYQQGTHRLVNSQSKQVILLQSETMDLNQYLGQEVEISGNSQPTVEGEGVLVEVASIKAF